MSEQASDTQRRSFISRLSLRTRITLWVVLIFFIIQTTLSLVILLYKRQAVYAASDAALYELSASVTGLLSENEQTPGASELQSEAVSLLTTEAGELFGIVVQGLEVDSRMVLAGALSSELAETVQESDLDAHARSRASRRVLRIRGHNDRPISAVVSETTTSDGAVRVIVGMSTTGAEQSVRVIAEMLLLGVPATLISVSIASWIVGGIAVKPLQQIEDFASKLSPENVGDPLEIDDKSLEVSSLHKQLQAAMERIEEAYEEQGRFLANVSHEIKTPISIIQAEAEVLLMKQREPAEVAQFVRSTAEEMHRLGNMVESFLLLTRVEHGEGRLKRRKLPFNELVMDSFEQCTGMATLHKVRLTPTLCDDDDEPVVSGNADLLQTAIGNLIRNAIRFSTEGDSVELTCATDDSFAVVSVRDHGPGIPEALLPRLFEPFTQASAERRRGRGTGLGLQIAKGIAELHHGDIRVENHDIGCEFHLRIPLRTGS